MPGRLAFYSTLALAALVAVSLVIALLNPVPLRGLYPSGLLANDSGFIALFLVVATGVQMVFKRPLLRITRDPEAVRALHVWLAGLSGFFIVVHVALLIFFPITLPVLFGYLGTYVAFAVWVTGVTFFEGLRGSLFYHGLLSLVGVSLIVVHVFGAGRTVPIFFSGLVLVAIAVVVLAGALKQFAELPDGPS